MKLDVKNNTFSNLEGADIGIELNSFIFDALINKGYKDKIGSVVREICCNAWDSHIKAGNDKPFDVHVPTRDELYFSCRDYGVGLCENDIYTTYTKLGASDKRSSNDFTGCLGIGACSPFAYVSDRSRNFTTTSWYNGTKTVYNCYLNESNIPKVVKLHEEPTNEPNGLEVHFDVERQDVHPFVSKSAEKLSVFEVRPNTNVSLQYSNPLDRYTKEYADHYVNDKNGYVVNRKSFVLMGNVLYPVSAEDVNNASYQSLVQNGVLFIAQMEDVQFTPFRENLEFNQRTTKWLIQESEKIIDTAKKELDKDIQGLGAWEKSQKIHELNNIRILQPVIKKHYFDSLGTVGIQGTVTSFVRDYKVENTIQRLRTTNSKILFNDTKKGCITKARQLKGAHGTVYLTSDESVLKELGLTKKHKDVILASSLTSPTKSRASTTETMLYQDGRLKNVDVTFSLPDSGYYIPTYFLDIVRRNGDNCENWLFKQVYEKLPQSVRDKTYAFRGRTLKWIEGEKNWTNIWDEIEKLKQKYKKHEELKFAQDLRLIYPEGSHVTNALKILKHESWQKFEQEKAKIDDLQKKRNKVLDQVICLENIDSLYRVDKETDIEFAEFTKVVEDKPLLDCLDTWNIEDDPKLFNELKKYMEMK